MASNDFRELQETLTNLSKGDTLGLILGSGIIMVTLVYGFGFSWRLSLLATLLMLFYVYLGRRERWKKEN